MTGGCLDLGAASLPYAPFSAILRHLGRDAITSLMPAAALPDLVRLMPALTAAALPPDDGTGQMRLFEHVLTLIERAGAAEPVVLVVEDAHWADRSTRDLLTFLFRNPPRARGAAGGHLPPRGAGRAAVVRRTGPAPPRHPAGPAASHGGRGGRPGARHPRRRRPGPGAVRPRARRAAIPCSSRRSPGTPATPCSGPCATCCSTASGGCPSAPGRR
ncbi:ATP-binding protein [Actinomadura madurae]|uniref:ATP-binding protein n=1 Tax=Actinomadura madurae TaxID=1993 RepID=UPI0035564874